MGSDNSDEENRDRVLAPDDLDITKQPEVEEIDDGRYVVSPNGPAKKPDKELIENPDWLSDSDDQEHSDDTAPQPSPTEPQPQQKQGPSTRESTRTTQPSTHPSHTDQSSPSQQPHETQSTPPNRSHPQQPKQPQPDSDPTQQSTPTGKPTTQQSTPTDQARAQQSGPTESQGQSSGSRRQPSSGPQPSQRDTQSSGGNSQPSNARQSTERRPDQPTNRELAAHDQPPVDPPAVELTNANVSKFLAEELTQGSGDYGFDATLNVEGQVNRGRMTSDDIGETLETLLRWYARQTTDEVEPETVLGIILAGSDLAVEYPVQSVYSVVKRHGLKPDDSISDLLAAVRNEGSFTVPPSDE